MGCRLSTGTNDSIGMRNAKGKAGGLAEVTDDQEAEGQLEGYWNWKHNESSEIGEIALKPDGVLNHDMKGKGGKWKMTGEDRVTLEFNGIEHEMALTKDKKTLILIQPLRNPPSVATWARGLNDSAPKGDVWQSYENIDMCGQGDAELIWDWKSKTTLEQMKKTAEEKNYSAITVSSGNPSFGHAALKNFHWQLTA